jgi:hypothetical protein
MHVIKIAKSYGRNYMIKHYQPLFKLDDAHEEMFGLFLMTPKILLVAPKHYKISHAKTKVGCLGPHFKHFSS